MPFWYCFNFNLRYSSLINKFYGVLMMRKFKDMAVSFRTVIYPLTALLLGTMFVCCAYASLGSVLALRLNQAETPTTISGIILALYYLGSIIASFSAPKFINKVGSHSFVCNICGTTLHFCAGPWFFGQSAVLGIVTTRWRVLYWRYNHVSGNVGLTPELTTKTEV